MWSHIYYEEHLSDHFRLQTLRQRFPDIPWIPIKTYAEIFNRKNQSFRHQKNRQALILAEKREGGVFKGQPRIDSFGRGDVLYTDQLRNCIFDCSYCFLQGMHRSAHLVYFINTDHYLDEISKLAGNGTHVSLSYLSDFLATERDFNLLEEYIQFASMHTDINFEIRTKSDSVFPLLQVSEPPRNFMISFSLSPQAVVNSFEHGCASIQGRLFAARQLSEAGWRIGICIDPVIPIPEWEMEYKALISELFKRLPIDGIEAISVGAFRMHTDFFKGADFQIPGQLTAQDARVTEIQGRDMQCTLIEAIKVHFPGAYAVDG